MLNRVSSQPRGSLSQGSTQEYQKETYLGAQWLRFHTSTAGEWVQSLVRELGCHILCALPLPSQKKDSRR